MSSAPVRARSGLIGVGAVGQHLGRRLLERFGELKVHDRDAGRCVGLVASGAEESADPRMLARDCEVVVLSLPSPAAVQDVMEGATGLLAGAHPGLTVLDTSTLDPGTSERWSKRLAESGATYLDTPVTCSVTPGGGTAAAAAGELTFLIGGDREAFENVSDVLETLGHRFHHLGPPGSGSLMKLVSNHLSGIQTLAIAEALNLARACGFSAERTLEICRDTVANSYVLESIVMPRLDNAADEVHFSIELMTKDHRLAGSLAEARGVNLPLNATALALCERMCDAGYGHRDNVASVEYFASVSNGSHDDDR